MLRNLNLILKSFVNTGSVLSIWTVWISSKLHILAGSDQFENTTAVNNETKYG